MDSAQPMSFEDAVFKLVNFEDKLQTYTQPTEVTPHMAFATGRGYTSRGRGSYSNRGGYRGRGSNSYSTRGRGFQQQFSGPGANSDGRPTCQICGRYGHSAVKCYNRFDQDYQSPGNTHTALAAMKLSDHSQLNGQEWYPDSAASAHITNNGSQLQSAEAYVGNDQVIVGNGDFLPITHVGSVALHTNQGTLLPLNDVLVCPEITKNLMYVSKLTSDFPCEITFDSENVCIKDKVTKEVITKGRRHKDLYMLKDAKFQAFYSNRQQATSAEVWHQRLGHPHKDILQHLSSNKAIVLNKTRLKTLCDACQVGKSSRLPFFLFQTLFQQDL